MTCVLVVPDGAGVRNFLHSQFLDCFGPRDRVEVWHALPTDALPIRPEGKAPIAFHRLPPHREGLAERLLRQAKVYGQLYWRREPGTEFILRTLRRTTRPLNAALGSAARAVGRLGASGAALARVDRWHRLVSGRPRRIRTFSSVLESITPHVVFCTHQRASSAVPAMLAARRLGIPTATFIYSWDNLPKGRMAVSADHFFVWSDHMKSELLGYYPEVDADRVHVVGTPQFEPYFMPALLEPRCVFFTRLGLDANRPVVCFSGCDVTTSPHDPVYLDDLAMAFAALPAADRPQIVFRRCPVDRSDRYEWVLRRHPRIAVSDPVWRSEPDTDWTSAMPSVADSALLANLACHCDLVVNFGSTMALDFAIVGKPGVFLAYEPVPPAPDATWTAREMYSLPHLKTVHELDPVHWVRSRADLASVVIHALWHPGEKRAARARWIESTARVPLELASRRCYEALQAIAQKPQRCTSAS